jgi:predicted AlkP superfamily phosphohydrolase/phosphomutase
MGRTLVVGFDGATLPLCRRFVDEGRMPALAGLMADGSFGVMRSTHPYNSAVAWTSLSTGASAGRHGIFDFVLPRPGEYGYRVATREDRRVPALWNYATRAEARVAVINIPMTFPAEPVGDGVMVSGMDAPRLEERSVHPAGFLAELRRLQPDYRIISNAHRPASVGDFDEAERELLGALEARGRFVAALAAGRDFDLVMVNLEATDGSHHFFWQHFDPSHPRHDDSVAERWGGTIGRVYEATDRELGRLLDAYGPETVFVVSDHGGGPSSDWVLFMNEWLASEGFLHLAPRRMTSVGQRLYGTAKARLSVPLRRKLRPLLGKVLERAKGAALYGDVDWSRSRAYAHMQPAVRLNLSGREPAGLVGEADRAAVLGEVAEAARSLRLPTGEPAFAAVYGSSEIYSGNAPGGPDLVMEPSAGLHIRSRNTTSKPGFVHRLSDLRMYLPSGVHVLEGMVTAAGAGVEARGGVEPTDIYQVAPSVLAVMGVPAPELDGRPFDFITATPETTGVEVESLAASGTDLDSAEEAEVLERLRGLGYVD